jgi:hypothetical protein
VLTILVGTTSGKIPIQTPIVCGRVIIKQILFEVKLKSYGDTK